MRFALTDEQHGFARSLYDLLTGADTPAVVRAWAQGDAEPGLRLWQRLAELGVHGLLIPESAGGAGAGPVELVVAFEALGRHAVPGPWVESVAVLPQLLGDVAAEATWLARLAEGAEIGTLAAPPVVPYALDADVATRVLVLDCHDRLREGVAGERLQSVDAARRLFPVTSGATVAALEEATVVRGYDLGVLACTAQLLGLGEHLLTAAVEYAQARTQFGRAIGSYQAVKHALADVRVALDFARPLVMGAALALEAGSPDATRDVSAAKVATGDAAHRAARTALQVHGAIGYTAEHDLGLWITKVRALVTAWGTPGLHRARVLESLTAEPTGSR